MYTCLLDDPKMAVDVQKLMSGSPHDDQNLVCDHLNFRPRCDDEILKITFVLGTTRLYVDDQIVMFGPSQTLRI